VHEIALLDPAQVQLVSGRTTMVIRDEVLPVRSLARLLGWQSHAALGCLVNTVTRSFFLQRTQPGGSLLSEISHKAMCYVLPASAECSPF